MRSYDEELWTVLVEELFRSDMEYSNAKQKRAALEAVLTMWSAREMHIGKRIYSREMIRTLILDELFRDDIDSAVIKPDVDFDTVTRVMIVKRK